MLFLVKDQMIVQKSGCVYIMANKRGNVLYTGVTSDLKNRVWEHKNKVHPNSFSAKYNCEVLLWFEVYETIAEAIVREKQIKAGNRTKKEELIKKSNPLLKDLWEEVQYW